MNIKIEGSIKFEGSFEELKRTKKSYTNSWLYQAKAIVDITHMDGSVKNFKFFQFYHFVHLNWNNPKQNQCVNLLPDRWHIDITDTNTYEKAVIHYAHMVDSVISNAISRKEVTITGELHSRLSLRTPEGCYVMYQDGHSKDYGTIKSLRLYNKDAQIEEINRSTKPFLHQDIVNIVTSYFA